MPNPLHSPEPESASSSQLASAGTLGAWGPRGIEVAAIAVAALYFGREVLIPVTLAMLLSFVLSPLVELLRRIWLGRILIRGSCRRAGPRPDSCPWQRDRYTGGAALWEPSGISDDDRDQDKSSAECYDRQVLGEAWHLWPSALRFRTALRSARARSDRRAGPGAAARAGPGGGDPAGPVRARYRQERSGADAVSVGDGRHHSGGDDIRPAAKGGSARPCHPTVRLGRSAPHHRGDGRGRAAAQPLFPDPARPQCQLWRDRRRGPLFHRRSQPVAVGHSRRAVALRSLCRIVDRRRAADGAGGGRRARLVDGDLDGSALRCHRT